MSEHAESAAGTAEIDHIDAHTPGCGTDHAERRGGSPPWYVRLQQRKVTFRKVSMYALVATLVMLSSPIAPTFIVGSLLAAAGIAVRVWTFGHLAKNQTMVTTGPYAHSRNPAYVGSLLILCGFVLAAGNPFSTSGLLVWGLGLIALMVFFGRYLPRKCSREYTRLE